MQDCILAMQEDKIFYQAESLDSVTTATDEMYSKLH